MLLDFEKPIDLLEQRLKALEYEVENGREDLDKAINKLKEDIIKLQKDTFKKLTRWQRVQLARHPDRPYTLDYINLIVNDFIELHGDRCGSDDKSIVGGLGDINGHSVIILGHQKGRTTKERQFRNFGMAQPGGYKKAIRLMKIAEKFNKPIITFIDTPGAYPGIEAEEKGQASAIASNLEEMFDLKVPIISIVIGEGASGGAIGIGVANRSYMLENTWYSVISPESCSSILWKSWDYKEQAADNLKLTAKDMQELNLIDGVIEEPLGGAHRNPEDIANNIKEVLLKDIKELKKINSEELLNQKIQKYRAMGEYQEKKK